MGTERAKSESFAWSNYGSCPAHHREHPIAPGACLDYKDIADYWCRLANTPGASSYKEVTQPNTMMPFTMYHKLTAADGPSNECLTAQVSPYASGPAYKVVKDVECSAPTAAPTFSPTATPTASPTPAPTASPTDLPILTL